MPPKRTRNRQAKNTTVETVLEVKSRLEKKKEARAKKKEEEAALEADQAKKKEEEAALEAAQAKKKKEEESLEAIREVFRKEHEGFVKQQEAKLEKVLGKLKAKSAAQKKEEVVEEEESEEEAEVVVSDNVEKARFEALHSLVDSLQSKVTEVTIKQEDLLDKHSSTEETLGFRLNAHVKAVNNKLVGPSTETFKWKSSKEAIGRISSVLEHLLDLQVLSRREINDWEDSDSAKQLNKTIELVKVQAEDIRVAEASPMGFKLLEAYKNKETGFRFVENKEKAVELKKIEAELLKDAELSTRVRPAFAANRFSKRKRSRSRSPSRSRSQDRNVRRSNQERTGNSEYKKGPYKDSFQSCYWCKGTDHQYRQCKGFQQSTLSGKAVYDPVTRRFTEKGKDISGRKDNRRSRSPRNGHRKNY